MIGGKRGVQRFAIRWRLWRCSGTAHLLDRRVPEKEQKLREELMDFSKIHPWNQWSDAPQEETQNMIESLDESIGCV